MSEKQVNIDIIINTAKSAKSLSEIKKAMFEIKDAQKAISKDSVADQKKLANALAATALEGAKAATTFRDQRQALKDLKDAMESVGPEDKQFIKLTVAAGQLEHKMKAVGDAIKYTSGTPIHNLSAGFKGLEESLLTGNFEEMEIAMKSMGNSMLQLAKGALKNLGDRFKSFGTGTAGIFKGLGKAMTGDLQGGLDAAKKGFKGLGDALKVNPLFLIVGVVLLIIDKFKELKESGGIIGKVFRAIGDAIGAVIQFFKDLGDAIGLTNNKAEEFAKNQLDDYKQLGDAAEKRYEREIKIAKSAGQDTYELEQMKLAYAISSTKGQIEAIGLLQKANGTLTDEQKKNLKELQEQLEDLNADVTVLDNDHMAEVKKNAEEEKKKAAEVQKKKLEEAKKGAEEYHKIIAKQYEELKKQGEIDVNRTKKNTQENVDAQNKALDDQLAYAKKHAKALDLNARDIQLLEDKTLEDKKKNIDDLATYEEQVATKQKEESDKLNKEDEDELKKETEKKLKDLKKAEDTRLDAVKDNTLSKLQVEADYLKQKYDAEIAAAKQLGEDTTEIEYQYQQDILKNQQDVTATKIELAKEEEDAKFQVASQGTEAIGNLSNLLLDTSKKNAKKQFELAKAISITTSVISGLEGVVNALSAKSILPEPLASIAKAANAIAIGAATAANVAKIRSTQFNPEGGTSGGGSSTSSYKPSNSAGYVNRFSNNSGPQGLQRIGGSSGFNNPTNPQPNGTGSNGQQAIKTYVSATDLTNVQDKNAVLARRASFS